MKNWLSDFFRFVWTFNLIGWYRMHFSSFFKQNCACFIFSPRAFSTICSGGVTSMPSVTSWKVIPGSWCLQTITTYNFNTFHAGNENSKQKYLLRSFRFANSTQHFIELKCHGNCIFLPYLALCYLFLCFSAPVIHNIACICFIAGD